ncbi:NADH-quinone oxidoreductase subunit M [soil metagenome]
MPISTDVIRIMTGQAPNLLTALLFLPLAGAFIIMLSSEAAAKTVARITTIVMCVAAGMMVYQFDPSIPNLQFENKVQWITTPFPLQYYVGVDGMSLCLCALTAIVILLSVYASAKVGEKRPKLYYSFLMLLTFSLVGVFCSLNLLQFFIFYEFELVPMYFLIAIWGGPKRDYAAMKFLLYTFFGGVLMLAALLYLYFQLAVEGPNSATFDMIELSRRAPMLSPTVQGIAFLGFFLAFIIKLPSFPFHTWLPDAHVEAPTPISMILAGLLLKMGGYGLIRICMGFFPIVLVKYGWMVMALGAFNIIWGAMACLVQQDMKRIIAFSSVSHMGFILLGIGCLASAGINGAIFQMLSHGIVSAALFFLVGTVYERTHTRLLPEIGGGLAKQMPKLFYFWMFCAMANLGLPGLSGFVGEVAVFYGSYTSWVAQASPDAETARLWIWIAASGVILTAGYMLWLLKRLFYGPEQPKWVGHLTDATKMEQALAWSMCAMILALGLCPNILIREYGQVSDRLAASIQQRISLSALDQRPVQ